MSNSKATKLTDLAQVFLTPRNSTHRQYEALRAYFVDGLSSADAARRFGYTPGSFRVMCHQFRQDPERAFFLPPPKGPGPSAEKTAIRDRIVALRKQNLSVYDIHDALAETGTRRSPAAISLILRQEGFSRLPRRRDEERPDRPRPERAEVADVGALDLSPRNFRTRFGGLFLFLPDLAQLKLDQIVRKSQLPGSKMIPAAHAMRSLLALKLFGRARHSHVMSDVMDPGLGLFAGLNIIPKRAFLTEYSCRIDPASYPKLMQHWFEALTRLGLERGSSFDLDFHTIPSHGNDALMEKHYLTQRSRRQKGILAFLAEDADQRVFCYANAEVRKADQKDEILRFVDFWHQRTGVLPEELVFDSKLTTHTNLDQLNQLGVQFITLRRRSRKMLEELYREPSTAWRRVTLRGLARAYRTPRVLDRQITLDDYEGPIRQLSVLDLGHEEPTLLLTNQLRRSPATLIGRYAQRMLIENAIADGIDFFHMNALSSVVAMKVNCDLQLTLMASSLYRRLGERVGNGYQRAKSQHLFRDFVDASAQVDISSRSIDVRFQKRAHNPLLLAAGYQENNVRIPWLGGRKLCLTFG
jgi:hypothetical protein